MIADQVLLERSHKFVGLGFRHRPPFRATTVVHEYIYLIVEDKFANHMRNLFRLAVICYQIAMVLP